MASFLHPSQIEDAAAAFLAEWNQSRQIPVPIEEIVELKMKIEVVPVNGLFKQSGVEGFFDRSLRRLYVDFALPDHRVRFTYAHEMGHHSLHRDILLSARFQDASNWKQLIQARSTEFSAYEIQAGMFAAQVLMPTPELAKAYETAKTKAVQSEPGLKDVDDETLAPYAAMDVGRHFDVSTEAAGNRLRNWLKGRGSR